MTLRKKTIRFTALALTAASLFAGCIVNDDGYGSDLADDENVGTDTAELLAGGCYLGESFDYEPGNKNKQGEATKCGEGSHTSSHYEPPAQAFDTGETYRDDAQRACAKWAMKNGTLTKGWHKPKCPTCPTGTDGCEVHEATSLWNDVTLVGSTYFCSTAVPGNIYLSVTYSCTKCTIKTGECPPDGGEVDPADAPL
jgi:hypothetical protein